MHCENCGTKIKEGSEFCSNCGRRIDSPTSPERNQPSGTVDFYSRDWRRKKVFAVASLPYFDVMIDDDSLYLIEMPKYSGTAWGLLIGLVLLNILGAAIGAAIGGSNDTKKRRHYRSSWISDENELLSRSYEKNIFLKIPLSSIKGHLMLNSKKFTLNYGDKMITLKKGGEDFEQFKALINTYVL